MDYKKLVLGGTFDLLHVGHKALIDNSFSASERVYIGVTTDSFNRLSHKKTYEGQSLRKENLKAYLKEKKYLKRATIFWLDDIYGATLSDPSIEAIAVTKETLKNAKLINQKRARLGFANLAIITVPYVADKSGQIISSSRIRSGEIGKEGEIYKESLLEKAGKRVGEKTRQKLKISFGKIVKNPAKNSSLVIAVGDITIQKLLQLKVIPTLSVFDLKTEREHSFSGLQELGFRNELPDYKAINPAGEISKELIIKVDKALGEKGNSTLLVEGEEDLAVIPSVLLSPLGAVVYYGQPKKGLVEVMVTPDVKRNFCNLLSTISQ